MSLGAAFVLGFAAGLAGCARERAEALSPPLPSDYASSFYRAEPILLGMFARADPRVAQRFSRDPRIPWRFVDPFLFDMRARGLEAIASDAQRCAIRAEEIPDTGPLAEVRIEQELLFRLIDEEQARLERERALPGSAADLLRATAATWPSIESAAEQRATESLVAWRLDQVRASLSPNALSALEREDLMDALAGLEQVIDRATAPHAETALARLKGELEKLNVAPLELRGFGDIAPALRTHLGVVSGEAKLRAAFAGAREKLHAQVEVAFAVLGEDTAEPLRRAAAERLARAPECPTVPALKGMRRLAPPPERTWVCAAVNAAARPQTEAEEVESLVLLHDLVTVGEWALDLHTERRDPSDARRNHPLLSRLDEARASRLLREAATHAVGPIGGASTIVLLLAGGAAHVRERAQIWSHFGDAPLDVVMREAFRETEAR